jgi:hypothetical protein
MDTSSPDFISLRVSRRAANNITMIGLVGGLAVVGLSAAMGERSHKGDRLQVAPKLIRSVRTSLVAVSHEVLTKALSDWDPAHPTDKSCNC